MVVMLHAEGRGLLAGGEQRFGEMGHPFQDPGRRPVETGRNGGGSGDAVPTVRWSLSCGGDLELDGQLLEVLGSPPGPGASREVAALLAPLLDALRNDRALRHCEAERSREGSDGRGAVVVRAGRSAEGADGYRGVILLASDHRRTQQRLTDLVERYRLLVEISPDMIVVHQDGVVRYMNPTGLRWAGARDASEVLGRPLGDFVAPESIGPLLDRVAELDRPGAVSTPTELVALALDGRRVPLEAQSARTTWDGKPAFQVFLRDRSEHWRAEAAIRYQANLLASVSDAVVATDLSGSITGWNPAASLLYRVDASAAIGRGVASVLGAEAVVDGDGIRPGEVVHRRGDGSTVVVRVAVAPLRDEQQAPCGQVAICADQSYRLAAAEARRLAESRFTTVVRALSEGIVVMASDGTMTSLNPAAHELLGEEAAEGVNVLSVLATRKLVDTDGHPFRPGQDPFTAVLATGARQHRSVFGLDDASGERRWWSVNCEILERAEDPRLSSIVCSITDVTAQRASERRLSHAATHDRLTGLANRGHLLDALGWYLAAGAGAAVLLIDLDRFKAVNDGHGHHAGDQVLRAVASRVGAAVGPSGMVGRLAGDEFVVILPDPNHRHAVQVAELIRDCVGEPIRLGDGGEVVVTTSIGIASTGGDSSSPEAVLADADVAMYQSKARGGSVIHVFDGALRAARSRRLALAERLRTALARHEVHVSYQPVVTSAGARVVGYEALARWTDSELGPIAPGEFIPIAEDHGLIGALGADVLAQACEQASRWRPDAHGTAPRISVNLSAHQLADPKLPTSVLATLQRTGLAAERLCLEVTESVVMADAAASIAILNELRSAGVRLVVDDFGTGYSSLSYLRRLPVDGIKIDRSFVAGLTSTGEDHAIVEAIVRLGHSLGLTITAEGVETEEQAAILEAIGCDTAQGYLYGRPHPLPVGVGSD